MDPTTLQALIGGLSFGLGAADAAQQLVSPAAGAARPTICMLGGAGEEQVVYDGTPEALAVCSDNVPEHHVVFLLSGFVYFGRMRVSHDKRVVNLTDTHYLLPSRSGLASLQLVRVGQELHAPEGELSINMTYVISWQRLANRSALMAAIINGRSA